MEYSNLFEMAGPCEGWPQNVLDAFVADPTSETVKIISKFAYDHQVAIEVLVRVLRNLPCAEASEDQVAYAQGLYRMWAAIDQQVKLNWCAPLEEFAGPRGNWPMDILQALQDIQSEETASRVAAWAYFHSIPLDFLTDVLQGQEGCSGDPALIMVMLKKYEELYNTDKELAIALDEAIQHGYPTIDEDEDIPVATHSPASSPPPPASSPPPPASSPSPPALTIVDLTQDSPPKPSFPQDLLLGPDLSRPEVLGRLGHQYVVGTLSRPSSDPATEVWKSVLQILGAPKEWPFDIRQLLCGEITEVNVLPVATFSFLNNVPYKLLCDYLSSRPQGLDSCVIKKIALFYSMWGSPTRGKFYRSERFAYSLKLKRYVDLNFNESSSLIAKRLNKNLLFQL